MGFGNWRPLSEAYARRKPFIKGVKMGGTQLLVLKGELVGSTTLTSRKYSKELTEDTKIKISTTLPYAKYIDKGTRYMPARRFTTYDDIFVARIKKLIRENIG